MASVHFAPTRPGIEFAKYVLTLARAKGDHKIAANIAKRYYRSSPAVEKAHIRMAAVGGGDSTTSGWASELSPYGLESDFVQAVRARTVVDKLTAIRRIPFGVTVPTETSSVGGAWVGQGVATPVSAGSLSSVGIGRSKAVVMIVLLGELLRSMHSQSLSTLLDSMVNGVAQYLDQQFLSHDVSAVANVSPASVTNGGTEVASTGSTAATIGADLGNMVDSAGTDMVSPVWIMRAKTLVHIAATLQLPGITLKGGSLFGIPIITSASVPSAVGSPSVPGSIVLLDQSGILIADEGHASVGLSDATSVLMDNAATLPGAMTSLFQAGGTAARITREIGWIRTRATAAILMETAY